MSNLQPPAYFS